MMSGSDIGSTMRAVLLSSAALAFAVTGGWLQAQDKALQPVTVEERRALLIGNASYTHTRPLVNTIPDVRELEGVLRELEFDWVQREENLTMVGMVRALDEFAGGLGPRDLGLFYFSGHGLQVGGENYLLPVDFERTVETEMPYTTLAANRVRERLEGTGADVRVLVLDACRDNPFGKGRNTGQGLAKMSARAKGTLIAYSAGPGQTASDNPEGALGLYMTHLLPELRKGSIDLETAFENAQALVEEVTNGKQFPALEDSIIGKVYLRGGAPVADPRPSAGRCEEHWREIRGSKDPQAMQEFLEDCKGSEYGDRARARLERLEAEGEGWQAVARSSNRQELLEFLAEFPDGRYAEVAHLKLGSLPPVQGAEETGGASPATMDASPPPGRWRAGEGREFDGMEFVWIPARGVCDGIGERACR